MVVEELLRAMMDAGASDLHLSVGDVPVLRRDGLLERLDTGLLDEAWMNAALERLLQVEPTWQPALELLGRLLTRRGDWAALVAMHRAELESLGDPRQRANQYYKIGELFELHLHDVAAAAEAYREAVELDPDFVHGARALARMLLAQGDHAGYVALLRQEVDRSLDGRERVRLYETPNCWADAVRA